MSKPTILIVDDEKHIVELVKFNLEKEGYCTIVARNGLEAYYSAKREKPDLIILDVMLPEMNGF